MRPDQETEACHKPRGPRRRWLPACWPGTFRSPSTKLSWLTDLRTELQTALAASYALERELGRGGMATVFLAQDLRHDRPVALKVLHPDLAHALGPERFQREIKLAARLQHPHILTVHDSGEAAGQLWFTMPFVEGESLRIGSGGSGSCRWTRGSGSPPRPPARSSTRTGTA